MKTNTISTGEMRGNPSTSSGHCRQARLRAWETPALEINKVGLCRAERAKKAVLLKPEVSRTILKAKKSLKRSKSTWSVHSAQLASPK